MALTVHYQPPRVDAVAAIRAAGELGLEGAGKLLLDASQQLVPEDSGRLKQSGQVTPPEDLTVSVSYGRDDAELIDGKKFAATSAYAVIQHEDMNLEHSDGKAAKFLETPMRTEKDAMLAALAAAVRAVL